MKQKIYFIISLFVLISNLSYSQAIRDIENLESVTFHERTTTSFSYTFDKESDELNTRLPYSLSDSNNDFQGWIGQEFFDVFYSDSDGTFNIDGAFITIEARFDVSSSGGGCNILGIEFNFSDGSSVFANHLESFFANGNNYSPFSELRAVDCDLDTWSSLGNTGNISEYLRLTIGIQNVYSELKYSGCINDGYGVVVNGNTYNQINPTGTETITKTNGCDSIVLVQLIFEDCENHIPCDIYIPNVFSPNQDGLNDNFSIYLNENCQVENFKIRIFSRWGSEVFYSEMVDFKWDGTFKDQLLNPGVFVWRIEFTDSSGGIKRLAGDVTLMY